MTPVEPKVIHTQLKDIHKMDYPRTSAYHVVIVGKYLFYQEYTNTVGSADWSEPKMYKVVEEEKL